MPSRLSSENKIFFCETSTLLQVFHSSGLSSLSTFGLSSWGGNAGKQEKEVLDKIIRKANGLVSRTQDTFDTLYGKRATNKLNDIQDDARHSLR